MIKKSINFSIYTVFIFGLYGAGNLAFTEFLNTGTCPKIGIVPACYIIFICLLIPFISHIFNKGKTLYFLFTSMALAIATYGAFGQLWGAEQCPKTERDVPTCYISFVIFASLIVLKMLFLKKEK